MIDKPSISDQSIIDCLKSEYGIEVAMLSFLPLGADMNAAVYKAIAPDQSEYFIKLTSRQNQDVSTSILSLLHEAGIKNIILPLTTRQGSITTCINDYTLTVSPFIAAQDGFSSNLTDEQWFTLGKIMRRVHDLKVPPAIEAMLRQENYSPKWREAVRSLSQQINTLVAPDAIGLQLQLFMREHTTIINRLVERAEQLSQKIQNLSPLFVLCHADIHGGNVLLADTGQLYVVDWDGPMMAPKERDLMFIGGGVANVWNKPHEEKLFYQGYGNTTVDNTILAYYRHERIVEDIALLGQQLLLTAAGRQNRQQLYQHFIAQFASKGVVEIAFNTDEIS